MSGESVPLALPLARLATDKCEVMRGVEEIWKQPRVMKTHVRSLARFAYLTLTRWNGGTYGKFDNS
jgi:hypothetical protein